jgi:hypothetical protein
MDHTEAELWLDGVVSQADLLATQWRLAPADVIDSYARRLSERLRELDGAANTGRTRAPRSSNASSAAGK